MTATASPDINPDTLAARILAQAADALIYAGRDGRIERWNAAAQRVFGFSAAEAIGQSLDLIIPEHLRAGHWRGWDAAMQTAQLKLNGQATLTRALDSVSTPSCTVACSCMLRSARAARAWASAVGKRQTCSRSSRASLPSMPRHHTSAAEP